MVFQYFFAVGSGLTLGVAVIVVPLIWIRERVKHGAHWTTRSLLGGFKHE
jgi:hypothetical protein